MNNKTSESTHRRYFIYILIFIMCTVSYSDRAALSVALPQLNTEFHLTAIDDGWLLSSYLWTYVICLVPMAMAVDRWGTQRVSGTAVAFWSIATAITAWVWSFGSLIATRLLLGLGESPCFPAGHRVIREWAPAHERGFAATVFTSGILGGVAFGALLSGWLISVMGWRVCFFIFGILGLLWVAIWAVFYRDPTKAWWLSTDERNHILENRGPSKKIEGSKISIRELLSHGSMWGLIVTQVCGNYTNVFFLTWLPSYLAKAHHISILKSGLDTAICYGIACIGTIAIGRLSDKILILCGRPFAGRRYLVAILLLGSGVMAFAPYTDSHITLLVLLTISLTCMQSSLANNQALTSDLLGDGRAIGTAIGLLFVFANALAIVAPVLTGFLVAKTGSFIGAFEAAATLTVIGALSALFAARWPILARHERLGSEAGRAAAPALE